MSPPLGSKPSPERQTELQDKIDAPDSFLQGSALKPISSHSSFAEVVGWFDEQTVLYLEEKDGGSILYTHHLDSGEASPFFESDRLIVDVVGNEDLHLFSIQTMNELNETQLVIVDQEGNEQMNIEGFGEGYSIYWNPYKKEQFIMVAYLPDFDFDVFHVDVEEEKITQLDVEQTYFQWLSETKLAYLKWEDLNFHAPLYEVDINTGEEAVKQEDVIAFFSFPDELTLSVTVDSIYDQYSKYTFYKKQEMIHEIEMPILNTYSEQWWTPFYTYDAQEKLFYFLRPKYSSDFISYEDGYELIAYNIEGNSEKAITELDSQEPIALSPNGMYLLVGNRFERVLDLKTNEFVTIWQQE